MSQQMEEKALATPVRSSYSRAARKIIFVKMLCSPVFVAFYLFFCVVLYRFCMLGNVKKRGSLLVVCAVIFLLYLTAYIVRICRMKVCDSLPEADAPVKSYGFYRKYFYAFSRRGRIYIKECDDKERDYLRLKYAKLPRHKAFFWKIPAIVILILTTVMTITAITRDVVQLRGKLAWYLFDMYHTPIISEADTEEDTADDCPEPVVITEQKHVRKYVRNIDFGTNVYTIDENNVLWGRGRNNYGQLGQGTQDYDIHDDMVKIAENVIHIDFAQEGFLIYLTEDNKLYGLGNAGCGALQEYNEFDWDKFMNGEHYIVSTPKLLMEDVRYAVCGRADVAAIKNDRTVWTWGTIYINGGYMSSDVYYVKEPKQILEDAAVVTGGWFNHAALLYDGTVWTWGYNSAGNCGVEGEEVISEPVQVAEDVQMVWTGRLDPDDEFQFNNTIIQKRDGSYWGCGEKIGDEERVVNGAEADYTAICSSEFQEIDSIWGFIKSVRGE